MMVLGEKKEEKGIQRRKENERKKWGGKDR